MSLTYPAPSLRLRQATALAQQIYASLHELQELADGEPSMEEELSQLHTSLNVLIHTMNGELAAWQQLALTAAQHTSDIVRFGKEANPLITGFLEGAISVRAGEAVKPLTKVELLGIDSWMPVHRGSAEQEGGEQHG